MQTTTIKQKGRALVGNATQTTSTDDTTLTLAHRKAEPRIDSRDLSTVNVLSLKAANTLTMSSREIAELTGSTHDNVLKTVRRLVSEGVVFGNETPYAHPQNGQIYTEFSLNFRNTMIVVSGYSVELRARIIDRWQELEAQQGKGHFAVPQTLPDALRFAADLAEQKELAEQQRDIAIATKAQIGSRREATAMNTASQAKKEVDRLAIELDKSKQYATVKRMEMLYHGQQFSWRLLKSTANEMGVPPIDVFDANYGTVKGYHADVWREAYALSIGSQA